jgi:hypothetical protein
VIQELLLPVVLWHPYKSSPNQWASKLGSALAGITERQHPKALHFAEQRHPG